MDTRLAVRNRILELCKKENLALNALANISGIPPSTLKGIVYDTSMNPGIVTIKKICDGLGISLPDFFDTEVFHTLEQEIR